MAGLEQLGRSFAEVLVRLGGVAALVLTAWVCFKVLVAGGGAERALRQGCRARLGRWPPRAG